MTKEPGRELTSEEWAQIEALRPKRPLTAPEIDTLRDKVLPWFEQMTDHEELRRKAREAWAKFYPIIFGAIGAAAAITGVLVTIFRLKP